jgi:hypothetical protein
MGPTINDVIGPFANGEGRPRGANGLLYREGPLVSGELNSAPGTRGIDGATGERQPLLNLTGRFAEHRPGRYPIDAPGPALMIRHDLAESVLKHFAALPEVW